MNIYFDTCALNRLTDDQKQFRIREEAEAVSLLLDRVATGELCWIGSDALNLELSRNPNPFHRSITLAYVSLASQSLTTTPEVAGRAAKLQSQGFGPFDATHLALAGSAEIEWLFTVDDRFLKLAAARPGQNPRLQVVNPLEWLRRRSPWLVKP